MRMNPAALVKLMGAKNQFTASHPKFAAFLKNVLATGMEEGTVIEITVTKPGQAPVTGNMKVLQTDLELFASLRDMAKGREI